MLKGDLVYLRAVEPSDVDTLLSWENNPDNWRVSETKTPFSRHLIERYVESAQDIFATRQIRFMICAKSSDLAIGSVDLFDYEPLHQHAGVGILIEAGSRGKGVALEALNLVASYALNGVGLRNLCCTILSNNDASQKLFERAGFKKVGSKLNWYNNFGEWLDEYSYQKELTL